MEPAVRAIAGLLLSIVAAGCAGLPERARLAADAPETPRPLAVGVVAPPSYEQAIEVWRTPEDVSAWIGARFEYDMGRALQLSETRRGVTGPVAIRSPEELFASPSGTCVDLARFAVETLRRIAPETRPRYLMIEFAPVTVSGHTLRRHWLAAFTRDGHHYVFADSKRPGHIAGPYARLPEFVEAYAAYRDRPVITFLEADSHARQRRAVSARHDREPRRLLAPPPPGGPPSPAPPR